jgi:hypothetical protein
MSDKPTSGSSTKQPLQQRTNTSAHRDQHSQEDLSEQQKRDNVAQADAGDRSLDDEGPTMGNSKSSAKKQ